MKTKVRDKKTHTIKIKKASTAILNKFKAKTKSESAKKNGKFRINKKHLIAAVCALLILTTTGIVILSSNLILTKRKAQKILNSTVSDTIDLMDESNFLYQPLSKNLSIKLTSLDRSGNGYRGKCVITSVDCSEVLIDYLSDISDNDMASSDEILAKLKSVAKKAPVKKKTFNVEFEKTSDGYSPVFTEDMVNFCNGNMQEVQEYLIERFEKENR